MTPQELKKSILQLAIQGKLVEQRSEDGNAEELYQHTQDEKQRFFNAGAIKKEKPLSEITEDEIPFDIPESWKWVRLKNVATIFYGYPFNSVYFNENNEGLPLIRIRDVLPAKSKTYTTESTSEEYIVYDGDMLTGMDGNFNVAFWNGGLAYLNQRVCKITADQRLLLQKYLYFYLPKAFEEIEKTVSYVTVKHLSDKHLTSLVIPLPPLAEQKRIVAKIEELLPYIERYKKAWDKLEDLNKLFPNDMQKSILQIAIQGKLVEQRPQEGTGEEFYQQIQAEKQALIKAGSIKKEKPLPKITEDEKPFDIPDNWTWVRLGNICSVVTGRLDANAQNANGKYAFFTCGVEVFKTLEYTFDCDAILLGGNNASGDYKMHRYAGKFNAYQRVYVITDPPKETLDYLFQVIKYWLPTLKRNSQGTTTRFIRLGQVTEMFIPLPPLAEQKRIVAKLEELLPLCEKLKK